MSDLKYKTPGPWDDEPDADDFEACGLKCEQPEQMKLAALMAWKRLGGENGMTEQAKHTPGPWRLEDGPEDGLWVADENHFVANCRQSYAMADGEGLANARLIAAAPEMAEELLGCLNMLEATNGSGPVPIPPRWAKLGPNRTFSHIRAVLQKAGILDGGI